MAKHNINFELYNKSDLFFKYKIRLELLQAIYGDNATVEEINKKNEEIRKGGRR
jgi:hypothetical protein